MTLLASQSLGGCAASVALFGISLVLGAILGRAPIGHVITPAGEDVHVFKHDRTDSHRAQPGPAIVPAVATAKTNASTPFEIHFPPQLANKPEVITAFDFFCLWVGVQYRQVLPFRFPFFICAINRALLSVIGRKSFVVHSRKPKPFCISEIKKIFCTDHLLSVSRALHGKKNCHGY